VVALAAEGFVTPVSPSRGVRLGPLIVRLAVAGGRDLPAEFRPLLLSLSSEVGETANLSVLEHDNAVVIAQVVGPKVLTVTGEVGEPLPSHVTSSGLALLSVLSDAELRRLFPEVLEAWTENTITDRELLLAEIAKIRTTGIAVAREYYTAGLCSVAVVVTKNVDRPVAISLPVPSFRFEEQEARLVDALLRRRAWVEGLCGPVSEAAVAESRESDAGESDGPENE
jgi:DNA-binding IclR family transcriptional regulator